ncbi:MAG: hypothetical protein AAF581_14125 [Planctomycetota bacterium]
MIGSSGGGQQRADKNGGRTRADLEGDARALAELRGLLVGPEQERLTGIQQRLDDPELHARDVARVLAEALEIRNQESGAISEALAPTIDETLSVSIRERPQEVADSLSPVMMPAIRKSIFDTIKSMMQSLNETLERSMSLKGLSWRWEAMRTGKPFAEVVLLRTLQYRVEHVFLIHQETGLLLRHLDADSAADAIEQPQAVSAMLTAIQDFVRDSFGAEDDESLEALQVGERAVLIERGPMTAVAAVVRGEPPQDLSALLRETQRRVRTDYGKELAAFDGDPAPFQPVETILQDCLVSAKRATEKKPRKNVAKSPLFWGALIVVGLLIAWGVSSWLEARRWDRFLESLQAEPGLVVIQSQSSGGYQLLGLRDPMAKDPQELLAAAEFEADEVAMSWQPFSSPHPDFVRARIQRVLAPPRGVDMQLHHGVLTIRGEASGRWIAQTLLLVRTLPEVTSVENLVVVEGE